MVSRYPDARARRVVADRPGDVIRAGIAATPRKLGNVECDPSHSVHTETIAPKNQQFIEFDEDSVTGTLPKGASARPKCEG